MRRTILSCAVAALTLMILAPPAVAGNATHLQAPIGPYEADWAAGELCDFPYRETGDGWFNVVLVGSEPRITALAGGSAFFTHENLDTGYVLTEKAVYQDIYFDEEDRVVEAGLYWHLRDPAGKIVVVEAGLVTYDLAGDVLTYTPNRTPDFAAVLCSALGGDPA